MFMTSKIIVKPSILNKPNFLITNLYHNKNSKFLSTNLNKVNNSSNPYNYEKIYLYGLIPSFLLYFGKFLLILYVK